MSDANGSRLYRGIGSCCRWLVVALVAVCVLSLADDAAAGTWKTDPAITARPHPGEGEVEGWDLTFTQYPLACNGTAPPAVEIALGRVSSEGWFDAGEVLTPHGDCGFWTATSPPKLHRLNDWTVSPAAAEESEALTAWRAKWQAAAESASSSAESSRRGLQLFRGTELGERDEAEIAKNEAELANALAKEKAPPHETLALSLLSDEKPSGYYYYAVVVSGKIADEGVFTAHHQAGSPTPRYYQGSDEFVNYCIDKGKEIRSENGRLYCDGEGGGEGEAEWVSGGWPARVQAAFLAHRAHKAPKLAVRKPCGGIHATR